MNLGISHLHDCYRSKRMSPRQLVAKILERSESFSDHNIWIRQLTMQELEPYLGRLEGRTPDELPLYGIPFVIKDNIDLAGIPTTAGCKAFEYVPSESAFAVQLLLDAGAIPLGKTNLDQFATGLVGTRSPEPWGACRNAFDPAYISGGSSSGSAAAVALGLASFSLGTDTAGSGRVPAAFNNLIGLKPSKGLISMTGVVPACRSLDCVSIFALTTDDANRVLQQAAHHDPDDVYARDNSYENNHRHYGNATAPFSFAVPASDQLEFFGDTSASSLFDRSIEQLQEMGGKLVEVDFSPFLRAARMLYEGPWVAERYLATRSIISRQPEAMLPVIHSIISAGEEKTACEAFSAEYELHACRRQTDAILEDVDFLVTPTAATIYTREEIDGDPIGLNSRLGYYTNYMNLLDCAAIAVPAGFLDNGLPWGITLVSTALRDRKLLSFANYWQQHTGVAPGKLETLPPTERGAVSFADKLPVVVCGAHLDGLPLNWQLRERGGNLLEKSTTSANYRMYVIEGEPPRPGLIRDELNGDAVDVEVWMLDRSELGGFVEGIPAPLGIGKVEMADGRWLTGFICEAYAVDGAREITALGGWRSYLAGGRAAESR